jgi:hypothetical protein
MGWGKERPVDELDSGDIVNGIEQDIVSIENKDVMSPAGCLQSQSVNDNVVPSPSLLEVSLSSILEENLVAFLNVDRLVRHFLT